MFVYHLFSALLFTGICIGNRYEDVEFLILNETSDVGEGSTLYIAPRTSLSDCSVVQCPENHYCKIFKGFPFCYNPDLYLIPDPRNGCRPESCLNNGTCNQYSCQCPKDVEGNNCETAFTPCSNEPCKRNEICVTAPGGGYRCVCPKGFEGYDCLKQKQDVVDVCSGKCVDSGCICRPSCRHENGYYCVNSFGFTGKDCSTMADIIPPSVRCEADQVYVDIPQQFVLEYATSIDSVTVFVTPNYDSYGKIDKECYATSTSDGFHIAFTPGDCGSYLFDDIHTIVYENTLWIDRSAESGLYHFPQAVLDFNCTYATTYNIMTSINPVIDVNLATLTGNWAGTPSIGLCKVSTCDQDCPASLVVRNGIYTVAQRIHVNVKVDLFDPHLYKTEISEAFLSCSDSEFATNKLTLYRGCERGSFLEVTAGSRTNDNGACMSFRLPRLAECSQVFLHVRMKVCREEDWALSICQNGEVYNYCQDLQKRDVGSRMAHSVIGPIVTVYAVNGQETISLKSDSDIAFPNNVKNPKETTVAPSSVNVVIYVLVALVFIVSLCVALLLYKRRYSRFSEL